MILFFKEDYKVDPIKKTIKFSLGEWPIKGLKPPYREVFIARYIDYEFVVTETRHAKELVFEHYPAFTTMDKPRFLEDGEHFVMEHFVMTGKDVLIPEEVRIYHGAIVDGKMILKVVV